MLEERFSAGGFSARLCRCNTAVVGTGAAGYNAADRLWQLGQRDILIVTENRLAGTSRNTGSDKQTYYKLTLSGPEGDSVREMAETLFSGQCVDGDIALCEAALSAQSFLKLVELGVPFPRNRYGEYIGYKTDHDPRRRATSVGPYTSRQMTECLEQAVQAKGIPMLDHLQVIRILSDGHTAYGLLCLDTAAREETDRFVLIQCKNIVYATGGPAGMYADSVYPAGHYGATGLALEAGVKGKNLTEWQYGLASVKPRWNVSGTYMQVLPRVYSAAEDGSDEREFLMDFFKTPAEMLSKLFLKGYQWPFDVRKVAGGSSIIDVLVYLERCKGRRVYLDYRRNPVGGAFSYDELEPEARDYLTRAGACFGTPVERLGHMNAPAVEFYRDKGVDLARDPLEISALEQMGALARRALQPQGKVRALWAQAARRMSECGAAIRDGGAIAVYLAEVKAQLASFERNVTASEAAELRWVYRLRDMLISQYAYLAAMLDYMQQGGKSRGSALYTDPAGKKPYAQLPDAFTFVLDDGSRGGRVQEMLYRDGAGVFEWRPVRPIPKDDDFFENVWREYRETGNVG